MKRTNYNFLSYLLLILTIIFHFFFINNYPINLEHQFVNFADYFENFDISIINNYLSVQANTIVFSYVIFIVSKIFALDNYLIAGKLLSISSYLLLFFSTINYSKYFSISSKKVFFLLTLLFFNPVIWIYGYRSLPDLFPSALGFFSISLLFRKKKNIYIVFISSILITIAALLKYIFLILIVLGTLFIFFSYLKRSKIRGFFYVIIYNFFPVLFISIYFFWFYSKFGFIISKLNENVVEANLFNYFSTFLYYLGFIFIFITPINITNFNFLSLKNKFFLFSTSLIMFYIGYANFYIRGELNFGTLFNVNTNIIKGTLFALSYISIIVFFLSYLSLEKKIKKYYIYFIIVVLSYVTILSLYRPAQRYLVLLIPFFYIFFFLQKKNENKYIYMTIIIFIFINFSLTTYSYYRSKIAETIINYLKVNSIISQVDPGPIVDSYDFNLLNKNKKIYKYKIVNTPVKNYVQKFTTGSLFFRLDYYLIKN
jgi:hypothetical protein